MDIISGDEAVKIAETAELVVGRPQYAADLRRMAEYVGQPHYKAYPVRGDNAGEKADQFTRMVNTIKAAAEREGVEIEIRTNQPHSLLFVRRLT